MGRGRAENTVIAARLNIRPQVVSLWRASGPVEGEVTNGLIGPVMGGLSIENVKPDLSLDFCTLLRAGGVTVADGAVG